MQVENELTQTVKKSGSKTFYFITAIIIAAISSIPMIYFVKSGRYENIWLLYLGDSIFLFCMIGITAYINKTKRNDAPTGSMLVAGHWITFLATITVCIITFIVLWIYIPDIFSPGLTNKSLAAQPTNMVEDKTGGLLYILFGHAILATFSAGSFATIITAYTIKKDQTKDKPVV